jgi:hypothetical protein
MQKDTQIMTTTLVNPNLTSMGYSEDNMLGLIRSMQSEIVLIRDSPKLAAICADPRVGVDVIYRAAGDDPIGDPTHKQHPFDFIQSRVAAAPTAKYIHMTNEVGFDDDLNQWNLLALEMFRLEFPSKKGVFYNASTNQDVSYWTKYKPTIMKIHNAGHRIAIHIYLDGTHDEGALAPYRLLLSWGIRPLVTEFNYIHSIFDANIGPRADFNDVTFLHWFSQNILTKYPELKQAPLFVFSADHWPNNEEGRRTGFGFLDWPNTIANFASINRMIRVESGSAMPQNIPNRDTLGTPTEGLVVSVPSEWVNIRQAPIATSKDMGDLRKGDKIVYRPKKWTGNGFTWYALESPVIGWFTDLAKVAPITDNVVPTLSLDIPYVSQEGSDAAKYRNDCGVASLLMAERWWYTRKGLSVPSIPTVNEISAHTNLVNTDYYLTFTDLIVTARLSGFNLETVQGMNLAKIIELLNAHQAPIILVSYTKLNPGNGDFSHFCVPYAYSDDYFWIHDPYKGGASLRVTDAQLDQALTDVVRLGNMAYQGLIIKNP